MAVQTTTGLAADLKAFVEEGFASAIFSNDQFLRWFISKEKEFGDSVKENIIVTTNSSPAVTAEGGSYPSAAAAVIKQGSFPYKTVYATYGLTDEAKMALGAGYKGSYAGLNVERQDALAACRDLFERTFMAAKATYSLQGEVDDDTTAWGGLDRSTYTALQSTVIAGGGAQLSKAMLENLYTTVRSEASRQPDLIMSGGFQARVYDETLSAAPVPIAGGGVTDISYSRRTFKGIPWVDVPDFLASELVMLTGLFDGSGVYFAVQNRWDVTEHDEAADVSFIDIPAGPRCTLVASHARLGRTAPKSTYVWGLRGALIVRHPEWQGKIEALTTS